MDAQPPIFRRGAAVHDQPRELAVRARFLARRGVRPDRDSCAGTKGTPTRAELNAGRCCGSVALMSSPVRPRHDVAVCELAIAGAPEHRRWRNEAEAVARGGTALAIGSDEKEHLCRGRPVIPGYLYLCDSRTSGSPWLLVRV
jgi:hypothetical protein